MINRLFYLNNLIINDWPSSADFPDIFTLTCISSKPDCLKKIETNLTCLEMLQC